MTHTYRNGKKVRSRAEEATLTPTEQKALDILPENGCSNKELADRMGIGVETAKTHINRAMKKKGFGTRAELIANLLHRHYQDIPFYGS